MQETSGVYVLGIVASMTAAVLFAVTNVIYKQIDDRVSIFEIVATRVWISLPFAALFILPVFNPNGVFISIDMFLVHVFSMIIGLVIGDTLYFMSQNRIGVSRAFPIAVSYPLLLYILAALYLGEPVIFSRVIGSIMVVFGVGLISYEQKEEAEESLPDNRVRIISGVIFALFTIVAWALSDFALQVGLGDMDAFDANFFRMLIGSVVLLPGIHITTNREKTQFDKRLLSIILATGILGYGAPMLLMTYAVDIIGATINSIVIASAPLVSAPLSIIFLKEELTKSVAIGTLCIVIGIILVITAL